MNLRRFFIGRAIGLVIVLVVLGIGYVLVGGAKVAKEDRSAQANVSQSAQRIKEPVIGWKFESAPEKENIPYTNVSVTVNGKTQKVGTFQGSCSELGASGGIDGKGLLAGELSAAQCWFAGGGDEIGVFATEDGGLELMTGGLSEGAEGEGMFRGDFSVQNELTI